jgi:tRNA modification GTPase
MYNRQETVAAICTPPGEGGVAIIRLSGPAAVTIADKIFSGNVSTYATHTVHYGQIVDSNQPIDSGLCLVMLGERSYTGEQTVELQCHGGPLVSRRVLEVALEAGARAALPGEFTFRAFMNGKLDLAQAEAVQEVIGAKSELAVDAAADQLQGRLSRRIAHFQVKLTELAAILEAWVDFPEEGIEFATLDELLASLSTVRIEMEQLHQTFHDGRLLSEGIALCLVGSPNVGKSSLMNALLDKERAIVTHIAGTTRDTLEDQMRLGGLAVRLTDTAGIRETNEVIEQEGIRRSLQAMEEADLVLFVRDASRPNDGAELLLQLPKSKTLTIWNKVDLVDNTPDGIAVSAKERTGLDTLRKEIDALIWENGPPARDQVMITSLRHKQALVKAIAACDRTIDALRQNVSPEFLCLDLREALIQLGTIIGTDVTEDILSAIFSKFCIGK